MHMFLTNTWNFIHSLTNGYGDPNDVVNLEAASKRGRPGGGGPMLLILKQQSGEVGLEEKKKRGGGRTFRLSNEGKRLYSSFKHKCLK